MDDITREQIRRNEESRSGWKKYESHRETVTQLILDSARNGDSLTVLGAGNCNDIDLGLLADHFEIISLVDVDRTAIATGLGRQNFSLVDKGFQVCETDVTGILSRLNKLGLAENYGADKLLTVAKLTTESQPAGLPSPAGVPAAALAGRSKATAPFPGAPTGRPRATASRPPHRRAKLWAAPAASAA